MFKKLLTTFFIASFAVSTSGWLAFAQTPSATPEVPKIVYVEKDVSVSLPDGSWGAAQKGAVLNEDTTVKTGEASYCDVALDKDSKNIISIGPNSEVKINKGLQKVNIAKGRVFSQLKALPQGSSFEVVTPQAIAGVRGTAWESIVEGMSKFNVKERVVAVQGLDKERKVTKESNVQEGFSVQVDASGWLGELTALTQEDLDRMTNWSKRIDKALGLLSKRNCGDLIADYAGNSANLFEAVVNCETQEAGSFASNDSLALGSGGGQGGVTGGDITVNSPFTVQSVLSPDSPPAPPKGPCPAHNPDC